MRSALLLIAACGAAPNPVSIGATEQHAPATVGHVVAVEEIGDTTVVLDETRAFVLRGGALASVTESADGWLAGAAVAAPDGEGRWALGIDRKNRLMRISISGELEDVTDRWSLSKVRGVSSTALTAAFVVDDGIAVTTDGVHLDRTAIKLPRGLATARGRIAMFGPQGVAVWDLARGTQVTYPVPDARAIAFVDATGAAPRLAIATERRLFVEQAGPLREIRVRAPIEAIAGSSNRLWVLLVDAGLPHEIRPNALFALDGVSLRPVEHHLSPAPPWGTKPQPVPSYRLFGSPTGDVWLTTYGALERVSIDRAVDDPAWLAQVAPVFQRVCAHCHLPGGDAGIDLSTPAAWQAERDELRRRVIATQTMPPAGTELSDADRTALAAWLGK